MVSARSRSLPAESFAPGRGMPTATIVLKGTGHYGGPAAERSGALRPGAPVRERIPRRFGLDPIRDVQVLCPMNRGGLGARSLNIELQKALHPPGELRVERFGWTFGPGDKVMQVANNHPREVYNGD